MYSIGILLMSRFELYPKKHHFTSFGARSRIRTDVDFSLDLQSNAFGRLAIRAHKLEEQVGFEPTGPSLTRNLSKVVP
jgi:hypothetical protein